MMVMYPLTNQTDYTELRYSLRSIEKFLSQPFEVVIIGDKLPAWINNITLIELPDIPGRKQISIRRKILAALEYAKEVLFFNDDVYLTRPALEFPYYWHGSLKTYAESGARPLHDDLILKGKTIKHFDGHYPLIYDQRFKDISENFSSRCIIKSMYCNYLGIEGTEETDCKIIRAEKPEIIRELTKMKPCFSSGTQSLKSCLPVLEELFPNKSNFELW